MCFTFCCRQLHESFLVLTYADQVHEAVHAVADLEEDVAPLPDGLRAESRPQQPGDAGHQEEGAQEHRDDLHLLHQGDGDGLPLQHREERQRMKWTVVSVICCISPDKKYLIYSLLLSLVLAFIRVMSCLYEVQE